MEDRGVLSRAGREPDLALSNADVYFGDPARPVILLIHGGFWRPEYDRTHLRPMAAALADLGWPVYSAEYRREPGNPAATVADVRAALESINHEVILMGHSAGGHLALWAAGQKAVRGTIGLAPVADLDLGSRLKLDGGAVDDFLGSHDMTPYQPTASDVVLIHGDRDTLVPISVSESYIARHPSARLVRIDDTAHFELIDPLSHAWPNVIHELERLLA